MRTLPLILLVACGPLADPEADALDALESDDLVTVTQGDTIRFEPVERVADVGLVFYPGGKVSPEAYAPPLRLVAEAGYPAWIVPVPSGLAIFGVERGDWALEEGDDVDRWVFAGHSLGGVGAAFYTHKHPELVDGLVLWASTTTRGKDLSDADLPVTSVFASEDGLFTREDWEESLQYLPADTTLVEIEGGNHAQFGDYGEQDDDLPASISPEEQWDQAAAATEAVLAAVAE